MLLPAVFLFTACTAGNAQFTQDAPAGFWWGLWHGIISVISLVIHVFNESVRVYEIDNTGAWYDFGFLMGVILIWGGGCHASCKTKVKKESEKEWEEVGQKVEKKVLRKLKAWAEEEDFDIISSRQLLRLSAVEEPLARRIRSINENPAIRVPLFIQSPADMLDVLSGKDQLTNFRLQCAQFTLCLNNGWILLGFVRQTWLDHA